MLTLPCWRKTWPLVTRPKVDHCTLYSDPLQERYLAVVISSTGTGWRSLSWCHFGGGESAIPLFMYGRFLMTMLQTIRVLSSDFRSHQKHGIKAESPAMTKSAQLSVRTDDDKSFRVRAAQLQGITVLNSFKASCDNFALISKSLYDQWFRKTEYRLPNLCLRLGTDRSVLLAARQFSVICTFDRFFEICEHFDRIVHKTVFVHLKSWYIFSWAVGTAACNDTRSIIDEI